MARVVLKPEPLAVPTWDAWKVAGRHRGEEPRRAMVVRLSELEHRMLRAVAEQMRLQPAVALRALVWDAAKEGGLIRRETSEEFSARLDREHEAQRAAAKRKRREAKR